MEDTAFQDQMPDNDCFGCGPQNDRGLRIKSFWDGPDSALCVFHPEPHQTAGPKQFLNGGIIATVIDCHCVCTAVADAYRRENRPIGSEPIIWYVTGSLTVKYLRPTPIDVPVSLRAKITEAGERKTMLTCSLTAEGEQCAESTVIAVRVPLAWRE